MDENQAVIVETLRVKNMLQNRRLAKAIADAGWYSLRIKIADKAKITGKHFVALDSWAATSKTCSGCGHRNSELRDEEYWRCPECGCLHDRDINAAHNIKRLGIVELRANGVWVPAHRGLRKTGDRLTAANEVGTAAAQVA